MRPKIKVDDRLNNQDGCNLQVIAKRQTFICELKGRQTHVFVAYAVLLTHGTKLIVEEWF
jgi:hypothetical protein